MFTSDPVRTSDCVTYHVDDHVAVITIDRPQARNAVSPEVAQGIEAAIDAAEADEDVWVAVLAGTPPVFCAGADLKAIHEGRAADLSTARGGFGGVARRERSKPLIAAVEGAALAGGTEIVLACDLVVAAEDARFGVPEVKRGLIAAAGGLFRLGRKIPLNLAMECVLTGDPIDAPFAHRHGLVNSLCAPGEALQTAVGLAHRITANAPLAVRESRSIVLDCTGVDDAEAWRRSEESADRVFASEDVREGVAAFLEKRAPAWTGR
ncbi:MAG: crotonase/enoyl-CoA hydratase family protein [Actinobacteria bacterium]|nr:MAG: crotonase/enoyl-CoA hydratase family protein [Actinomycetota bacterium]